MQRGIFRVSNLPTLPGYHCAHLRRLDRFPCLKLCEERVLVVGIKCQTQGGLVEVNMFRRRCPSANNCADLQFKPHLHVRQATKWLLLGFNELKISKKLYG